MYYLLVGRNNSPDFELRLRYDLACAGLFAVSIVSAALTNFIDSTTNPELFWTGLTVAGGAFLLGLAAASRGNINGPAV